MIFLFTEYDKISDEILSMLISKLPDTRRRQALRFRFKAGKISCASAYLSFLYGFRNIYKQNGLPDFSIEKNGKPYLSDYPNINFNISHCSGAACCIFGSGVVGVDIQEVRSFNMRSAMKVCSSSEIERICASSEPDMEFCRIWTVKEALLKLNGDGIFRNMKNLSAENVNLMTCFLEPDTYLTAASYSPDADFSVHRLTLSDLMSL